MALTPGLTAGGVLGGIESALQVLKVDEATINGIIAALSEGLEALPRRDELPEVGPTAFGTLPTGQQMGLHTSNAREFMLETYEALWKTLAKRADDVREFAQEAENVDIMTYIQLARLQSAVDDGEEENA